MRITEIVLALLLPPLAVALRGGTTGFQVALTFILWMLGWFPGVIYALFLVTADQRQVRNASFAAGRPPARIAAPRRRR